MHSPRRVQTIKTAKCIVGASRASEAVASASIDCIQQLLARCELTATLRVGARGCKVNGLQN